METFGERVRRLRKALGLSQAELAKRAGLSGQSAIANIENGKRTGSRNNAKLAAALRVTADYLETGKGGAPTLSKEAFELATIYESLSVDDKLRMFGIARAMQATASASKCGEKLTDESESAAVHH